MNDCNDNEKTLLATNNAKASVKNIICESEWQVT